MLTSRIASLIVVMLMMFMNVFAGDEVKVIEATTQPQPQAAQPVSQPAVSVQAQPQIEQASTVAAPQPITNSNEIRYTLGPDDVIEITVQRHPEFSGVFPINLEGKIQCELIGDIEVTGLTKKELEAKLKQLISGFVVNPEVNVTITEYRSKVYYVLGEVGRPGKYFMRSESIAVREAVVEAGLPTVASAMRKCQLITPDQSGKPRTKKVNLYDILYGGNLKYNIDMKPGDVLYVPSTLMAKLNRVISPVSEPILSAASTAGAASTGQGAVAAVRTPTRPTR